MFRRSLGPSVNGWPRHLWTVRATARVQDGAVRKTRIKTWSIKKYGLQTSIREACQWRFAHAPSGYASEDLMFAAALYVALSDRKMMKAMEEAGITI